MNKVNRTIKEDYIYNELFMDRVESVDKDLYEYLCNMTLERHKEHADASCICYDPYEAKSIWYAFSFCMYCSETGRGIYQLQIIADEFDRRYATTNNEQEDDEESW